MAPVPSSIVTLRSSASRRPAGLVTMPSTTTFCPACARAVAMLTRFGDALGLLDGAADPDGDGDADGVAVDLEIAPIPDPDAIAVEATGRRRSLPTDA